MKEFTFLREDQVFGDNPLDIFKTYGKKPTITDFSILLGGFAENYGLTLEKNKQKITIPGWYWTKTPSKEGYVRVVGFEKSRCGYEFATSRMAGARPVIPYQEISSDCSSKVRGKNGIIEVEYGEYPQTVVPKDLAKKLEEAYSKQEIKETGKTYTTDSSIEYVSLKQDDEPFKARTHIEYEYNGKKYIRFVVDKNCKDSILSDRSIIKKGDVYWVEVEPIKWIIDEKENLAISDKIIFSGIKFNRENNYQGFFNQTDIKRFMDEYFSKEIISSASKDKSEESENLSINDTKQGQEDATNNENIIPNSYDFNFDKVSEEDIIKGAIESGIAVFLHGKSSDGKSARIKKLDPECIIIYLRNATPDSLNGKSVYNSETGEMIDVKPTWLKKLEEKCEKEPNKIHIVFLDELTNALPSIQGIAFNIVLDREVNGIWQLPENARIVAAGNETKDSLAANQLAEPLFNRFAHVYIETTVENWLKWARENHIHPAICAYIAYRKDYALRTEYDGEKPNADPRKWEMASKLLYKTGKPEMLRALIGDELTKEFCEFCQHKIITIEDVLQNNYTKNDLQMNASQIYATLIGLTQVDEENFEKVREFVQLLGEEPCAIFDSLWAQDDERRLEIIAEIRLRRRNGGYDI